MRIEAHLIFVCLTFFVGIKFVSLLYTHILKQYTILWENMEIWGKHIFSTHLSSVQRLLLFVYTYSFPRAAVTNHHQLGDLRQQTFILSQ